MFNRQSLLYFYNLFNENTPIEKIEHPDLDNCMAELWLKRDDLIHPAVSGNKWRKLKYYVEKAKGREGLVTFGGAYSNHIAATASIGKLMGINTVGIIRGDELHPKSNKTLQKADAEGMRLLFVTREEYSFKHQLAYHKQIKEEYGDVVIVPEGGAGYEGLVGATEIIKGHDDFDVFAVSCGTGTTLAGILLALKSHQHVLGFSALKGEFMKEEINKLINQYFLDPQIYKDYENECSILEAYHFGGYAKVNQELVEFMRSFYQYTGIKLDPIYSGKMMFGLFNQLKANKNYRGKKILAIHTGGMQALMGVEEKLGFPIF